MPLNRDEDLFKREEDRKWRERVDERVASLTAGETVQDDRLDDIEEQIAVFEKEETVVDAKLIDLERRINELRALMQPDQLGNGGIISRIKKLEKREEREEKSLEYRWKFWLALLGLVGTLIGICIKEWPSIEERFNTTIGAQTETTSPKKARRKKRRVVVDAPEKTEEPRAEGD